MIICLYVDVKDLCDTNINVSNAIKLSHLVVMKDLCETKIMSLVLLRMF